MQIEENELHIWSQTLEITREEADCAITLLSPAERERAQQFHLQHHRLRFISAHRYLRNILSLYLNLPPDTLMFEYSQYKKPFLDNKKTSLHFNLSHSHDMLAIAITLHHPVGIDIEKIETLPHDKIAARFFSPQEIAALAALSPDKKISAFYCLWTRKEALLKAIGTGLHIPLNCFSVQAANINESLFFENQEWRLLPLDIHPHYQSTVATHPSSRKISFWTLINQLPVLKNVYSAR